MKTILEVERTVVDRIAQELLEAKDPWKAGELASRILNVVRQTDPERFEVSQREIDGFLDRPHIRNGRGRPEGMPRGLTQHEEDEWARQQLASKKAGEFLNSVKGVLEGRRGADTDIMLDGYVQNAVTSVAAGKVGRSERIVQDSGDARANAQLRDTWANEADGGVRRISTSWRGQQFEELPDGRKVKIK